MNWQTIYISGKSDFTNDVRKKLEDTKLQVMPGYIDTSTERAKYDLYWLGEGVDVLMFKKAIGSKLIWKYRLRFFLSLEEFIASQQKPDFFELTDEEQLMLNEFRKAS